MPMHRDIRCEKIPRKCGHGGCQRRPKHVIAVTWYSDGETTGIEPWFFYPCDRHQSAAEGLAKDTGVTAEELTQDLTRRPCLDCGVDMLICFDPVEGKIFLQPEPVLIILKGLRQWVYPVHDCHRAKPVDPPQPAQQGTSPA